MAIKNGKLKWKWKCVMVSIVHLNFFFFNGFNMNSWQVQNKFENIIVFYKRLEVNFQSNCVFSFVVVRSIMVFGLWLSTSSLVPKLIQKWLGPYFFVWCWFQHLKIWNNQFFVFEVFIVLMHGALQFPSWLCSFCLLTPPSYCSHV